MGVKFDMEGPLLRAKFNPHRCNVSPLWGEKPQNRPLSKLGTGALRCVHVRNTAGKSYTKSYL